MQSSKRHSLLEYEFCAFHFESLTNYLHWLEKDVLGDFLVGGHVWIFCDQWKQSGEWRYWLQFIKNLQKLAASPPFLLAPAPIKIVLEFYGQVCRWTVGLSCLGEGTTSRCLMGPRKSFKWQILQLLTALTTTTQQVQFIRKTWTFTCSLQMDGALKWFL